MANDEGAKPDEGAEEIQVGQRGKLPMIIAAVVALLLGAGGTFGAMKMMGGDDGAGADKSASDEGSKKVDTKMTTLGEFTVNLRASSSRTLQMEIQVETELETAAKVEERMPQIRDSVILLASDYSVTELEGIDGKLRLRDEIQARVNAVLEPAQVNRVYFTAFVVN
jgi:flagellar basal body-associated protein FliL